MLNVLSLFSGIGAFEKALKNNNVDFNLVNYCEIDKYASKAYSLIHNVSEDKNLHDVTKIDTSKLSNIDLITYGFPCQDISQAGVQKGLKDNQGNLTRSGLFFEALRVIKELKPAYAIAENVKALTSKKFKNEFELVLNSLEQAGYKNYYKVLNAKDFGIPQNRERVFIVSIRNDIEQDFAFPVGEPLKIRLEDMLESKVDAKFYLSEAQIKGRLESNYNVRKTSIINGDISPTICARDYKEPKCIQIGNIVEEKNFKNPQRGRVYDRAGLAPTLNCVRGGGLVPKILSDNLKIRKLTPLEYWRLMGFTDEDFLKCSKAGISNSQLYKQAGNSIVVNVLRAIFKELIKNEAI